MAIAERNEMIVSLICDIGDEVGYKIDLVSTTDDHKNTILHYAAKLAPSAQLNLISGVALQMQREVQWFKARKMVSYTIQIEHFYMCSFFCFFLILQFICNLSSHSGGREYYA